MKSTRVISNACLLYTSDTVTYVAKELGYTNAMFVHGLDGLDEISLLGATKINQLKDGIVTTYQICPEDFGLKRCTLDEIKTGTPEENAATITGVFKGEITGPRKDAIEMCIRDRICADKKGILILLLP